MECGLGFWDLVHYYGHFITSVRHCTIKVFILIFIIYYTFDIDIIDTHSRCNIIYNIIAKGERILCKWLLSSAQTILEYIRICVSMITIMS